MLASCESRWFFPIESFVVPQTLLTRFGSKQPAGERIDRYLWLQGSAAVGVKWRGGEQAVFEVKSLVSSPRAWRFKPGIGGQIDQWTKWRVSDPQLGVVDQIFAASATWVSIRKKRFLRHFQPGPVEVPEISFAQGCNAELTAIEIVGQARRAFWCSLGFEAYGAEKDVLSILDSTAETVFASDPGIWSETLSRALPVSYPVWLTLAVHRPER